MSEVIICDRCKKSFVQITDISREWKFKDDAIFRIRIMDKPKGKIIKGIEVYDLCPECAEKFKEFMNISDKDIFDSNGVKIKEGDILINDNHWDLLVVTDNNYPGLLICVSHDAVRRANHIGEMSLITAVNMGYHVKENNND